MDKNKFDSPDNTVFNSGLNTVTAHRYYQYLRTICKYTPRTAMACTLMRYAHSKEEYKIRAGRICKVLNRNDAERGG